MTSDFPTEGMQLTHLLVVGDLERARAFYHDVLGAELYREYGGTSAVLRFLGTWLLLVTGGEPTRDKPDVTFRPPPDPRTVSHEMTIRVLGSAGADGGDRGPATGNAAGAPPARPIRSSRAG
jgi:catechol 2,3-dioxygenase-like lactoylglutathione lyase family enzyme